MSPRLPHLKSKEVVRLLKEHGFEKDRQAGSHAVFLHPDGRRTTVPMHGTRTVGIGLLRQILRDADIDPTSLRK
jgi:predicted RNA binding protein YcfA (HicA-like mRNA interferase family)